ncbi:hypothetical protein [Endozoicomonas sp. SESOKO1]|uniref:hypothetical protein n=1 Tax=Endozoicomonas sp. SESOKO1 TaxID=2828742 RepID=UPI00214949FB|nr:hypothetical protein [Endozoicomonas sp. SESOKO1]
MKHIPRYELSSNGIETSISDKGLLFVHSKDGVVKDFYKSGFQVVGVFVDTIRPMYKGAINIDFLTSLIQSFDAGENSMFFDDIEWSIRKSSKSSGYQYILQNNDIGLTILYKNWHKKPDVPAAHLKIECSPWFIDKRPINEIQDSVNMYAEKMLLNPEPNNLPIHLAVDVQGWEPDKEMPSRIKHKAKRTAESHYRNVVEFDIEDVNVIYNNAQSFRIGAASSVQLAIYNKTRQSKDIDKLDYMRFKWSSFNKNYDDEKTTFRIELRLHHTVLRQFCWGSFNVHTGSMDLELFTYQDVVPHINALWLYALERFKFMYNKRYYDPLWTILMNDIDFNSKISESSKYCYQRAYKKSGTGHNGNNVYLTLGNLMPQYTRNSLPFDQYLNDIQSLSIWNQMIEHYESKGVPEHEFIERERAKYNEQIRSGKSI